jgi:Na+-translocating ferredoxin:NAD+ oxidoreductase RNF subunit RnfB
MNAVLVAVILVVAIGFIASAILSYASKVFAVEQDPTQVEISEVLPGANCGGCGYAGCDDYAKALASDRSLSCSKCVVGGAEVADKIAKILGVTAEDEEKTVAVVQCNGTYQASKTIMSYQGIDTCKAAKTLFGGMNACKYGCMGLGDCKAACKFDAMQIVNGVAVVDRNLCTACGACARACPNELIRISPAKNIVFVRCSSREFGKNAMSACSNACIGCGKCEKTCKFDAVHVEDHLAFIDPEKCRNCGMCAKACPTHAIINLRLAALAKKREAKAAEAAEA